MESQAQYRNLHHVSFWEIAVAHLSLWRVDESLKFWKQLVAESTVKLILFLVFMFV